MISELTRSWREIYIVIPIDTNGKVCEACYEMGCVQMRRLQYDPSLGHAVTSGATNTNKE